MGTTPSDRTVKSAIAHFQHQLGGHYTQREIHQFAKWCFDVRFGMSDQQIILNAVVFSDTEWSWLQSVVERLKNNEPIQYILETAFFYGKSFVVNPHVLIPRPETEELVHLIAERHPSGRLIDIGTGSGVIPIALKLASPSLTATGLDISEKALEVARQNAHLLNTDVHWVRKDICVDSLNGEMYDIMVSNPPYIPIEERTTIPPNVLHFEPKQALFVEGKDPLIFYRKVIEAAQKNLVRGGHIYFEIHENHGAQMHQLVKSRGFTEVTVRKDLNGKDRFLTAQKSVLLPTL